MKVFWYVLQDWKQNKNNTKGRIVVLLFRLASLVASNKITKVVFCPYLFFYRFFIEWLMCIELPWNVIAGKGFKIFHGQGMVVNKKVKFGNDCTIRQSTTIGNSISGGKSPVIGDNVNIGANVCILGNITIGNNVVIGAGAVVVKDVPSNVIIAGNPARIIRYLSMDQF